MDRADFGKIHVSLDVIGLKECTSHIGFFILKQGLESTSLSNVY